MDLLPLVFSSGWASGVNAYLAVLVLGLSERFGGFDQLPDTLGRADVLMAAAVLAAIEFVADKIPYVDSTWDAVSTVIRPSIGTAYPACSSPATRRRSSRPGTPCSAAAPPWPATP